MLDVEPFKIDIPAETLDAIRKKVIAFPWHEMPDDGGWEYGTNLNYMKKFCDYWVNGFDWRKQETRLNQFTHFKSPIDGIDIHFIYEKGSGRARL
jgi:hypothetical protein